MYSFVCMQALQVVQVLTEKFFRVSITIVSVKSYIKFEVCSDSSSRFVFVKARGRIV